jgi:nucleolar GTP-binding protein
MSGEDVLMRDAVHTQPTKEQIWRAKAAKSKGLAGVKDLASAVKSEGLRRSGQTGRNTDARQGEGDRRVVASKPKHMFVGKRKMGKTNRR